MRKVLTTNTLITIPKQETDRLEAIEQARLQQIKETQQREELAQAQALAAKERKRRQKATALAVVSGVLFLVAAALGMYAYYTTILANHSRQSLNLSGNQLTELSASLCVFKNIQFDYSENPLQKVPDCFKKE